jgi:hypothetical protein
MITVTREPFEGPAEEPCCICWKPTKYWYEPKDVPCCKDCAKHVTESDIPSKTSWLWMCEKWDVHGKTI